MTAANETKKIQVAFGPVAIVRAIPSREISVINVEVPEEFHVEVTNLLYRRDVLITLSTFVGAHYGILDPEDVAIKPAATGAANVDVVAVHGRVSGVRALPSRGVSIISVEVPEEAHVEVTQILYGRDVIVIPVVLGTTTPYGVSDGQGSVHTPNPRAKTASPHGLSSLIRLPAPLNLVKWVGARCSEDAFQDFLGVRNEAQAADSVRRTCGIETRKELETNAQAKRIFLEKIYHPFTNSIGAAQ